MSETLLGFSGTSALKSADVRWELEKRKYKKKRIFLVLVRFGGNCSKLNQGPYLLRWLKIFFHFQLLSVYRTSCSLLQNYTSKLIIFNSIIFWNQSFILSVLWKEGSWFQKYHNMYASNGTKKKHIFLGS